MKAQRQAPMKSEDCTAWRMIDLVTCPRTSFLMVKKFLMLMLHMPIYTLYILMLYTEKFAVIFVGQNKLANTCKYFTRQQYYETY